MATFNYEAYTKDGHRRAGQVAATSREEAFQALAEQGLLPVRADAVASSLPVRSRKSVDWWFNRISISDWAELAKNISVLLEAGLALDAALRLVATQSSSGSMRGVASKLVESVVRGDALSKALDDLALPVPTIMSSLVRAGEARGNLAPALGDTARILRARADLQARVSSALIYPVILAVTGIVVLGVIVTALVPALIPLFEDAGVAPPLALSLARDAGRIVEANGAVAGILLLLLSYSAYRLRYHPECRSRASRLLLRLPLLGRISASSSTGILARTLATLLRNGVPLLQAMRLAAAASPNTAIGQSLTMAVEPVKEGRRIGAALQADATLPDTAKKFIAIGEEAGKLDTMLFHLADLMDEDARKRIESALSLLTPTLTIIVGGLVGTLVLSVMQALLSLNQLALR